MTYPDSSTAHLSAWDFHLMTLNRERPGQEDEAWEQLPEPFDPDHDHIVGGCDPTYGCVDDQIEGAAS